MAPGPPAPERGPNQRRRSRRGVRRRGATLAAEGVGPDENLLRLIEGDLGSDQTVLRKKLSVTEREAEVLLWIARGKSNRDIAEILSLSPRTVNKHLEQIYAKLGVENRTSAAALAVRTLGVR